MTIYNMNFLLDVAIRLRAGLTEGWDVTGDNKKAAYKAAKREVQQALIPGGGQKGIAWEFPDASVSLITLFMVRTWAVSNHLQTSNFCS